MLYTNLVTTIHWCTGITLRKNKFATFRL
jgi:hypothetical protein